MSGREEPSASEAPQPARGTGQTSGREEPSASEAPQPARGTWQTSGGPVLLDCRGQRCPLPVIALARRIQELPVGSLVRVLADDPAAAGDIAAWCRMRGQEFAGSPQPSTYDVRRLR